MGIVSLKLVPTVNAELTPALNQAGISSCNLIRFKEHLPEKLGGWSKFYPFALTGIPRDIHAWKDLNSNNHLAIGTVGTGSELIVISNGTTASDITPLTVTSNFTANFSTIGGSTTINVTDPNIANVTIYDSVLFNTPVAIGGLVLQGLLPIISITGTSSYTLQFSSAATSTATGTGTIPSFNITSGSQIVTVNLPTHGQAVADRFTFLIPTSANNFTVDGTYPVNTVPTANTFTISANTQGSATTTVSMNSGLAQLVYSINMGPQAVGVGYGLGGYGLGGYGTGVVPASQNGSAIIASDWTLDNWGEILLACPKDGGIYQWSPAGGFLNAGLVPTAPPFNAGIFVSMPAQILVAWGSIAAGVQQDPMIVRWSDQENFGIWTVSSLTQAGSYRIPRGSRIVGGLQAPQQSLLWTDLGLWAMVYQGPPFVFGFNEIMTGCGLIGPHAMCVMRGGVYWMSTGNFFVMGGAAPASIPCTVWDVVFQDLDTANQIKCVAAPNSAFDEVTFYYPSLSGGSGEVDSYVKYNIEEKSWDFGRLDRTAWSDQSVVGEPIGTTSSGIIYQHEVSPDADGQPLMATFTTGFFAISEGQDLLFVDWFHPDMKWKYFNGSAGSASIQITIEATDYPNGVIRTYGPFTMTAAKEFINMRLRGRLIRLTYASSDLSTWWRVGNMRYRTAPAGRR